MPARHGDDRCLDNLGDYYNSFKLIAGFLAAIDSSLKLH
jgi:hypothetical protein